MTFDQLYYLIIYQENILNFVQMVPILKMIKYNVLIYFGFILFIF